MRQGLDINYFRLFAQQFCGYMILVVQFLGNIGTDGNSKIPDFQNFYGIVGCIYKCVYKFLVQFLWK